jgi:hypothetical protein
MNSLLLDAQWDITTDVNNNLAIVSGGQAIAQDVACVCRTWLGELWYDVTQGVPYQVILNARPALQFLKNALAAAAATVPGVASIACFLTGPGPDRVVGGQIQITPQVNPTIVVVQTTNLAGDLPWWVNAADEQAVGADT